MLEINGYKVGPQAYLRGADLYEANLSGADLRGAKYVARPMYDIRGYCFYVVNSKDIRAGCHRWLSFDEARAHYGKDYASDGNVEECIDILNFLERAYLRSVPVTEG